MENKIEVGEYVRTTNGIIDKVIKTYDKTIDLYWCTYLNIDPKNKVVTSIQNIVKHSKNIISLLESEDIVVLEYYVSKYRKRIKRKFEIYRTHDKSTLINFENSHCSFLYDLKDNQWLDGKGFNPKIKEIVTKEQFDSVKYITEEEKK